MYEDFQKNDVVVDILTGREYLFIDIEDKLKTLYLDDRYSHASYQFKYDNKFIPQFYRLEDKPKITIEFTKTRAELCKCYIIINKNTQEVCSRTFRCWDEAIVSLPLDDYNYVIIPIEYGKDVEETITITEQR